MFLKRWQLIGVWLFFSILGAACSTYQPSDVGHNQLLTQPYRLDTGDSLRITVFDQRNLTNTYVVDASGYLAMPLIGSVPARGRTTHELEAIIAKKLRAGYLRDPDVSVEVTTHRPFFIMGEVRSAGQYSYIAGMTVQTAIAIAGGFSTRANKKYALISRQINGKIINSKFAMTDPIRPGDTIYIRERWF